MKTLLLSAIFVVMFLLVQGSNQTVMAQNNPNMLTLDFDTSGPYNHRATDCKVKARVAYVATGVNQPQGGWTVTFALWSGPGPVPLSGTSNGSGLVRRTITSKTEIRASVQSSQNNVYLYSAVLKCPDLSTPSARRRK